MDSWEKKELREQQEVMKQEVSKKQNCGTGRHTTNREPWEEHGTVGGTESYQEEVRRSKELWE